MNQKELIEKLREIGVDRSRYCLDEGLTPDRVIMKSYHGIWEVFYLDERGSIHDDMKFYSEDEACRYIYKYFEESYMSIPGQKKRGEQMKKIKIKEPIKTPDVINL